MGWYADFLANQLHSVIEQGSYLEAKLSVTLGANVNKLDEYGSPPLWHSIVSKRDDIIVLLLKNKADPNQYYKDLLRRDTTHSILQGSVYGENESLIQLLILHGAQTHDILYDDQRLYLKEGVVKSESLYQKLTQLQAQIEQDSKNPWIFRELADFWQAISEREQNRIFKNYYVEKSLAMVQKAEQVVQQLKKKLSKGNFHHEHLEEGIPLLTATKLDTMEQKPIDASPHLKKA